jgi:hypothetical protein
MFSGLIVDNIMWLNIVRSDTGFFRENWRVIGILSHCVASAVSGFALAFFCIFALAADYTRFRPAQRASLFAAVEGGFAIAGIIGSQMSGFLMERGPFYCYLFILCLYSTGLLISIFVLQDSTPPEIKARKVDWWRANAFGALAFLIPTRHSQALFEDDRQLAYEELCREVLHSHVGAPIAVNAALVADNTAGLATVEPVYVAAPAEPDLEDVDGSGGLLDAELGMPASDAAAAAAAAAAQGISSEGPRVRGAGGRKHAGGFNDLTEGLIDGSGSGSVVGGGGRGNSDLRSEALSPLVAASPSALQLLDIGLPLPAEPAKRGNALVVFSVVIFFTVTAIVGSKSSFIAYMKQVYSLKDREISNVTTIEAVSRSVGTFLMVPLLHRVVTTRVGELRTVQVLFLLMACGVLSYYFCDEVWEITAVIAFSGFFSSIPVGFIRGLMSTEVGVLLQGKVLAAVAAVEVLTALFSALMFTSVFAATNESFPEAVYMISGSLMLVSALLPFCVSDSKAVFNSRRSRPDKEKKEKAAAAAAALEQNQQLSALAEEEGDQAPARAPASAYVPPQPLAGADEDVRVLSDTNAFAAALGGNGDDDVTRESPLFMPVPLPTAGKNTRALN